MNEPADIQELIDRHFHGLNSPEETARLEQMILSDPHAGAAMAEAARFEAMLQQRIPLRRKLPRWRPLALIGGLAAAAAAVIMLWPEQQMTAGPAQVPENTGNEDLVWEPIETAVVPLGGSHMRARTEWEELQQADAGMFVPAPQVSAAEWGADLSHSMKIVFRGKRSYNPPGGTRQAQLCYTDRQGAADLGNGRQLRIAWIAMSTPKSDGVAASPVAFDTSGALLPSVTDLSPRPAKNPESSTAQTSVTVGIVTDPAEEVGLSAAWLFDAASRTRLATDKGFRILDGDEETKGKIRVSYQAEFHAHLYRKGPLTLLINVSVPGSENIVLPLTRDARRRSTTAEAEFLGSLDGLWTQSSCGSINVGNGVTETHEISQKILAQYGQLQDVSVSKPTEKEKTCTVLYCLTNGLAADVAALTAEGEVAPVWQDGSMDRLARICCFPVPRKSIQALRIRPYSWRLVSLDITPPTGALQGLNDGVTDALELRLPEARPFTETTRVAVTTQLGLPPDSLLNEFGGFRQESTEPVMNMATLRQILQELGRLRRHRIEIEVRTRQLRSIPLQ